MLKAIHRPVWGILLLLFLTVSCKKETKTEYVGIIQNVGTDQPESGFYVFMTSENVNDQVYNFQSDNNGLFRYSFLEGSEKRNVTVGPPFDMNGVEEFNILPIKRNQTIGGVTYDIYVPVLKKCYLNVIFKANDTVNPPKIVDGFYILEHAYKSLEAPSLLVKPKHNFPNYKFDNYCYAFEGHNNIKGTLTYENGSTLSFDTTIFVSSNLPIPLLYIRF